MQEPTIGILGGMGPEATVNCFAKLVQNTPGTTDQDHLRVVIVNNPQIPDRIDAIRANGPSPLPVLLKECATLKKAGVDFIIIPCVTVHYFIEALKAKATLPIISILDAVVDTIVKNYPQLKKMGLLGTEVTLQSGMFQKRLASQGIETIICEPTFQQQVIAAIAKTKHNHQAQNKETINQRLVNAANHLVDQGAQGIIAGCTEIPLALTQADVNVPYFDSQLILARAAIRRAGREPIRNQPT